MFSSRGSDFLSRRELLRRAHALALASMLPVPSRASRKVAFSDYPFKLGVASGDPLADGFVIWTRLAPEPFTGGGMPHQDVAVRYQVATDERMLRVVKDGAAVARPELAHSVRVDIQGLEPDRPYWYRFYAGGEASSAGRTRTFPVLGAPKERMRVAWSSCQDFGGGYFTAYRDMAAQDLDLVLHLGDYIYETASRERVRFHLPEPTTLDEYRNLHALYKSDADLQRAHASFPWAVTWDDHDVDNDYAGIYDQEHAEPQEAFIIRRAAAYKAYYEHMPLRLLSQPMDGHMRLYTSLKFGDLATFAVLDTRQYRSDQACPGEHQHHFGGRRISDCEPRRSAGRSMLGKRQEAWLGGVLRRARTYWRVIAQPQMMAELDLNPTDEVKDVRWSEGWDGYAATRERILTLIERRRLPNVIVLSGDMHQYWVNDLELVRAGASSGPLATEFVGTSVTSISSDWAEKFLPKNPHTKYHEWRYRGYMWAELTPQRWITELRAVRSVADPNSDAFTLKRFAVTSGRAGAVEL